MIASKRAEALWQLLYPGKSLHDEFKRRGPVESNTLRADGDGVIRRQTPCGAILVIARNNFIIDVYPVNK